MEVEPPRDEEHDRDTLLDTLATVTDRAPDKAQMREPIEEFCNKAIEQMRTSRLVFDTIAYGMRRCAMSLPIKAPVYATIMGILTSSPEAFAKELAKSVTTAVSADFANSVRDGKAGPACRTLRFLACLANCNVVTASSVADYILALLRTAHHELTDAARSERGVHCRGPFLAEIGLSALPWAAKCIDQRAPEKLQEAVHYVDTISQAFHPDRWRCVAPSTDSRCVETFAELIAAVTHLKATGWVCTDGIVPRPQDEFEMQLSGGQQLNLPQLSIPSHSKLTRYSAPRFRLCLVNSKMGSKGKPDVDVEMKASAKAGPDDAPPNGMPYDVVDGTVTDLTTAVVSQPQPMEQSNGNVHSSTHSVKPDPEPLVKGEKKLSMDQSYSAPLPTEQNDEVGRSSDPAEASNNDMDVAMPATSTARPDEHEESASIAKPQKDLVSEVKAAKFKPQATRSPLVHYILRSYVRDVVDNFAENHMMAAERLLNMPMFKNVNDEIVDGVFSEMCSLPNPQFTHIYYGTLFVDLCRVKDSRLPAKLLSAVETMFYEAEEFDPEIFDRLADWFSFHLSNFQYKWNWADWALYADQDMMDKFPYRALFCKDVLARCIRLSYYERIVKMIPSEMKFFLPPPPGIGDRSRFKEEINGELMTIVTGRNKKDPDFVGNRLEELIPVVLDPDHPETEKKAHELAALARLAALLRSILQAGCKTLSHFDIVSERYENLLRTLSLAGGHPARRLVTMEVKKFWKDVHIRRMYVLDKLRARGVIDGPAIIDSCLAYEDIDEAGKTSLIPEIEIAESLSESMGWELIRLVFLRAVSREEAAREDLQRASQAAAAANEGETEKVEAQLQQAKANTEKAKKDIAELLLVALRRLFGLCSRLLSALKVDVDQGPPTGDKRCLPGFSDKPIWYWRCAGMIRELSRKHPRHVPLIIDQLDTDTKDNRDQHRVLWESFEVIKEVEGSAMLPSVW